MADDRWRLGLVAVAIAVAVGVSAVQGTPAEMPAASLEWPLLLHLERALALLGLAAAALLVGLRATHGRFPSRLGQIEYPTDAIGWRDTTVTDGHEERLRFIEDALRIAPPVHERATSRNSRYDWS
jgi:hypothetical protein